MGVVNRPRAGEKLEKAAWVDEAIRLATIGWSLRRIAKHVGRAHSTVSEALAAELEARRPNPEEVELARKLKAERLHAVLDTWMPRAIERQPSAGLDEEERDEWSGEAKDAALVVAKFEDLLARLEGTDAPKKTELTGANGGPVLIQDYSALSDEQLERVARGEPIGPAGGESEGGTGDSASPSPAGDGGVGE
jgi:hypothetical protein